MTRFKKRLLVFLFAQSLLWFSVRAYADCPSPDPKIKFLISYGDVGKSYGNGSFGGSSAGHLSGNAPLQIYPSYASSSGGCRYLNELTVQIKVSAQIQVSDRYAVGSCQQQVVSKHEDRHLEVLKSFYNFVPTNFTPVLTGLLHGRTGFQAGQEASISQVLASAAQNLQSQISNQHKQMQLDFVDSPRLMQQEYAKCGNW